MSDVSWFCCFQFDIAVRIIGTISLVTYTLVFIALVSGNQNAIENEKVKAILGFDSQLFYPEDEPLRDYLNSIVEAGLFETQNWFAIFCLAFAFTAAVSSALLILSSVIKQRWLTIPWLLCSVVNVVSQVASLTMLAVSHMFAINEWFTAVSLIHSIVVFYFFVIVIIAQTLWGNENSSQDEEPERQEDWENIQLSPPRFSSPYENYV